MSENLVDYKIITIYPTIAYLTYLFCKKYYKYMLHYNLLVLDMCKSLFKKENFLFEYSLTSMEVLFKMEHFKQFLTHLYFYPIKC